MFNGVNTNTGYRTDLDGLATLRLRAGRAFDGTLAYATAGLALGQVENRFTLDLPELGYASPGWSEDGSRQGYAVGAGIERAISARASFKAEVLYYDLDDTTVEARDPVSFPGQALDYRFDNRRRDRPRRHQLPLLTPCHPDLTPRDRRLGRSSAGSLPPSPPSGCRPAG